MSAVVQQTGGDAAIRPFKVNFSDAELADLRKRVLATRFPERETVADATLTVLRRTVPASVPTINFLSGGQTPEEATANLNAINAASGGYAPWVLSFSFARALQDPVMQLWGGNEAKVPAAQKAFHHRLHMNSLARDGKWAPALEKQ